MRKSYSTIIMLLIAAVLIGHAFTGRAEAAKYRFASMYAPDNYVVKAFQRVVDKIKQQTNGEVDITIYPSDQLGNYENCYQEVMRGTIDMIGNYPSSRFNKKFDLVSCPGLTMSDDQAKKLLSKDSPLHKFLEKCYAENGVVYLGSYLDAIMYCNVGKGRKLDDPFNPATKKGLTVRVVPVASWRALYTNMGYSVATVPFAEIFSSLQTGIIDADTGMNTEQAVNTLGDVLGAHIQYLGASVVVVNDFCISKKTWNKFDDKTKKIIIDAFESERESEWKEATSAYYRDIETMKTKLGMKIFTPTEAQIKSNHEIAVKYCWPEAEKVAGKAIFNEINTFLGNK
ncbi:MAG: TRAP transporter substrate-binding protein DctP [Synergistes sp.]|nr:TRAP transporter substrate-binding protein DctP [Synergistes sp.]